MGLARETTAAMAGQIEKTFTERGSVYGEPEDNFANIAAFWNAWINARFQKQQECLTKAGLTAITLDGADVGHMSALIKKARLANSPDHTDSALDDAVYTLLAHGVALGLAKPIYEVPESTFIGDSVG